MPKRLFRWAPTPSGPLHLGNVFSFVLTSLLARRHQADVLLRIDDLDAGRARPEHIKEIFSVLRSLGLSWQRGPCDLDEFFAGHSQALRQELYAARFSSLLEAHSDLFFLCDCSRAQVAAASPGGVYPGTCRAKGLRMEPGRVWRARVPAGLVVSWPDEIQAASAVDLSKTIGDFVVFRKDALFSYQWVSLCEDLEAGVTDIVRGKDLESSTAAQLWLGSDTEFENTHFWHHPLVLQGTQKLSKSGGALAVSQILQGPHGVERIYSSFARWVGLGDPQAITCYEDLEHAFLAREGELRFGTSSQIDELL